MRPGKKAKTIPSAGENAPEVVADGSEDGVGGVAGAALEITTAEMTLRLQVPDRFDGGAAPQAALNALMPRFWPEMKSRRGCGLRGRAGATLRSDGEVIAVNEKEGEGFSSP